MPNKSKVLGVIEVPRKYFFDFLLGAFDGDDAGRPLSHAGVFGLKRGVSQSVRNNGVSHNFKFGFSGAQILFKGIDILKFEALERGKKYVFRLKLVAQFFGELYFIVFAEFHKSIK